MRQNTLIIYDWDDTLFPTTILSNHKFDNLSKETTQTLQYTNNIKDVNHTLSILDKLILNLLDKSLSLGHVLIITNATKSWVKFSGIKYIPNTYEFILASNIPIISAREFALGKNISNHMEWKNVTFNHFVRASKKYNKNLNNFVSIGDSILEKNALVNACSNIKNSYTKTIKYVEQPNIINLIKQNVLMYNNIVDIVSNKKDNEIYLLSKS
jgi:hypothetical protein